MSTLTAAPPQTFSHVDRIWPDGQVVILGGGSSLTQADVDYCRDKAHVIAIKEAGCSRIPGHPAMAPWAEVLYASDERWWTLMKGAPEFTGLKYGIEQTDTPPIDWPGVQVLRNTGSYGLETAPTGLRAGFNSGYAALNLAAHLGASKVVLLGFDCWRGPTGEQNWFGDHPSHQKSPYAVFLQAFASIAPPLKLAGVDVVNASAFTILTAFTRVALREAL